MNEIAGADVGDFADVTGSPAEETASLMSNGSPA